jgi:hypothetical protein
MMRVEDFSRRYIHTPVNHYMRSSCRTMTGVDGKKVSTYFYPSLAFPDFVDLQSITLVHNNKGPGSVERKVHLVMDVEGVATVADTVKYTLVHPVGNALTVKHFAPLSLLPRQMIYFVTDDEMKDSSIVLCYKV